MTGKEPRRLGRIVSGLERRAKEAGGIIGRLRTDQGKSIPSTGQLDTCVLFFHVFSTYSLRKHTLPSSAKQDGEIRPHPQQQGLGAEWAAHVSPTMGTPLS